MTFHLKNSKKNNFTTKMKLYTTGKFISNDISLERKNLKKIKSYFTTKMKLYTTGEFMSNDISFEFISNYISFEKK